MDWQPIETAPKDGTAILSHDGHDMMTVRWDAVWKTWDLVEAGSFACDGWVGGLTPWMPLPEPPK